MYIYIYIERERYTCISIYIYIYMYICIYEIGPFHVRGTRKLRHPSEAVHYRASAPHGLRFLFFCCGEGGQGRLMSLASLQY